ncbi:IQ motif-containing protein H isoform X3 [Andrena cerasifolii]|uniref:IQ motif-containing protein H isoform X3 n=1 Tax=Andrena cerasifolii TaxID=2819439 RepID=UPI0040380C31
MEHHHEYLQTAELYPQCADILKESLVEIKHEITLIKKFLGDRKKEVVKKLSTNIDDEESCTLELTRDFYAYSLKELITMEEECEEYLLRMEIDLAAAMRGRGQQPSYLSYAEASSAYRRFMCCNVFDEVWDETSCRCTWSNVPPWCLEDTRNILLRPKEVTRSEFDETDLKFKQEMTYLRTKMFSLAKRAEALWLESWQMQFQTIDGKQIAATLIQANWRGYALRSKKWNSECLYIAASMIWLSWITLKQKREIHQRYLTKMLTSLHTTREISLKLSAEFNSIIQKPHVVLHLPSIGYPVDLRRTLSPKTFAILQNTTSLRICSVRNPASEVIYILPVKPTEDLLLMYSDFIDSISSEGDIAKRITFIALSQAESFQRRSLNLSRILHCSEDSLKEIRKKIAGKPVYSLPWIIDECDMRVAGNLGVALLSPDMELEHKMLNLSEMAVMIDGFGLLQPPHARDIRDYETLCASLAHLIVLHTEICMWLIKLNFGLKARHCGIFLINHISIPFMPVLRRERLKHGEKWKMHSELREELLERLKEHLPKVVFTITRLSQTYSSWKDFYAHVQKFGCLLQAVPVEKHSKTIAIALFIPAKRTGEEPRWMGTADKMRFESTIYTSVYMIPQSSFDVKKLEPTVNKFATGMQNEGYFGYLTVDCYCYSQKDDERLVVMLLHVHPYYSHAQSYIDWMKFAIGGWYNTSNNQFIADIPIRSEDRGKKLSLLLPRKTPKWNETTERYAIAISQVYHTRFSAYRWSKLKSLFERCNIKYDSKTKQGASILLHDGEIRNFGLMVAVTSCMKTTLSMVQNSLMKLNQTLTYKSKIKAETNLSALADFFKNLSLDYENLATDPCTI